MLDTETKSLATTVLLGHVRTLQEKPKASDCYSPAVGYQKQFQFLFSGSQICLQENQTNKIPSPPLAVSDSTYICQVMSLARDWAGLP